MPCPFAAVCSRWCAMVAEDGKLWDGVVAGGGVTAAVRARFWSWVCGAGGRPVPKWR